VPGVTVRSTAPRTYSNVPEGETRHTQSRVVPAATVTVMETERAGPVLKVKLGAGGAASGAGAVRARLTRAPP
jgi:hypothetical protein